MSKYSEEKKEKCVKTLLAIQSTPAKTSIRALATMVEIKTMMNHQFFVDRNEQVHYFLIELIGSFAKDDV